MSENRFHCNGVVLRDQGATLTVADPQKLAEALEFSLWAQRGSPFWIGDLMIASQACGDEIYQYLGSDWSQDMINRYVGVARSVPQSSRVEGLSWSHHNCVTKVPQDKQRELLLHAKESGMTSTAFRAYVKQWQGNSTTSPRASGKPSA